MVSYVISAAAEHSLEIRRTPEARLAVSIQFIAVRIQSAIRKPSVTV